MSTFDDYDLELENEYAQNEDASLNEDEEDADALINYQEIEEEADQPALVASFRERQQISAGRAGADTFAPLGGALARAQRTPEEIARIQIEQAFDNPQLSFLRDSEKEAIRDRLVEYPNIQLYNIDTLVKASAYLERNKGLDEKKFQAYAKLIGSTGVNQIDLVRYIRLLMRT